MKERFTTYKISIEFKELRSKIISANHYIPEAKTPEEAYSEVFNYIFNNII